MKIDQLADALDGLARAVDGQRDQDCKSVCKNIGAVLASSKLSEDEGMSFFFPTIFVTKTRSGLSRYVIQCKQKQQSDLAH